MGFSVGSISSANTKRSMIDFESLQKVREQILNPNNEKTVDVSKLNLSKFNRVDMGTDLYSPRTTSETALRASMAASDFGVKLSNNFNVNVQYLNSQAAQSLFTSKENNGRVVINVDTTEPLTGMEAVVAASEVVQSQEMKQDKRGQNPFAFYFGTSENIDEDDMNNKYSELDELSSSIFVPTVNILA